MLALAFLEEQVPLLSAAAPRSCTGCMGKGTQGPWFYPSGQGRFDVILLIQTVEGRLPAPAPAQPVAASVPRRTATINHCEACESALINRTAAPLTGESQGRPAVIYQHSATPDVE
ncbi:unnamed protein product [Lota lota]